jgi:hypothetical protein
MKKILFVLVILFFVFAGSAADAVIYHVDPDCGTCGTGDGTDGNCDGDAGDPFCDLADVNAASIGTSDDIYFKSGTVTQATTGSGEKLNLAGINGTDVDRVVVGCYWLDGGVEDYDCLGAGTTANPDKPFGIIQGSYECIQEFIDIAPGSGQTTPRWGFDEYGVNIPNGFYEGIIQKNEQDTTADTGYVTIQQLEVRRAHRGIDIGGPNARSDCPSRPCDNEQQGIIIKNNYIHQLAFSNGITLAYSHDSLIERNIVTDTVICYSGGAAITTTGGNRDNHSYNNLIQYNTISKCEECVGLGYKQSEDDIAQFNLIWTARDIGIYSDRTAGGIIRWNVIYEAPEDIPVWDDAWAGIRVQNELYAGYCAYKAAKPFKIYGNYIVGHNDAVGISAGCHYCSHGDNSCYDDMKVYAWNNTLVDNQYSMNTGQMSAGGYTGTVVFENNLSYTLTTTGLGSSHYTGFDSSTSPVGVTFAYNGFDDNVGVSGKLGNSAVIGDPLTSKSSTFRSYTSGGLDDMDDVEYASNSPMVGAGHDIQNSTDCSDTVVGGAANEACMPIPGSTFGAAGTVTLQDMDDVAWNIGAVITSCVPATPSITDPTPSETGVEANRTVDSSAYADQAGCSTSHLHSDWEIDNDSNFSSPLLSTYNDTTNKITWTPTLPGNSQLYIRVRHANTNGDSGWSPGIYFETVGDPPPGGTIVALLDGTNVTMQYCVFDGESEETTGIKIDGASNKIYNSLVINSGSIGIDANVSTEVKNTLLRNNAGADIDILTAMTVTASNNSIQDAAKAGDGTYTSGTSDFSKPDPLLYAIYKVGTGSHVVDAGADLWAAGQTDITGKLITNPAGDPLLGTAIDIGVFETFPQPPNIQGGNPIPLVVPFPIPK